MLHLAGVHSWWFPEIGIEAVHFLRSWVFEIIFILHLHLIDRFSGYRIISGKSFSTCDDIALKSFSSHCGSWLFQCNSDFPLLYIWLILFLEFFRILSLLTVCWNSVKICPDLGSFHSFGEGDICEAILINNVSFSYGKYCCSSLIFFFFLFFLFFLAKTC